METPKQYTNFIGLDGGGTSTKAVLTDQAGKILAETEVGPSNPNNVGTTNAARHIAAALRDLGFSELNSYQSAVVCGIAGLANPNITASLRSALFSEIPYLAKAKLQLTHDLEIAHYAAFQNQEGLLIIAGTGSACYARFPSGETERISGRSENFDDPGSGYAIAKQAISLRLIPSPRTDNRHDIAALALQILELAQKGNPVARGIISTEVQQLISLVAPLATQFTGSLRVALLGSVLANSSPFRDAFWKGFQDAFPDARLAEVDQSPQYAAADLAKTLNC